MGMIRIEFRGSFGNRDYSFSAMKHGHAAAVGEAIETLAKVELQRAIRQDHDLQQEGVKPELGFGITD